MKQMPNIEMAQKIAKTVFENGGRAYFVGGYVRDMLSGKKADEADIDIEVHKITPSMLCEILDSLGERIEIGESFGIFSLKGYSIDIAMPRKETNRGHGHRDFDICVDPFITTENAAKRRDFTINAMMQDILTGEIIDHFGGREDLKNGIIRHVDDTSFVEDPLRVLRAAQFAARFKFKVADKTTELCKNMDLKGLSKERVMAELTKALLKAEKPSIFFEVLRSMGQLSFWFKELYDLIGVEQNKKYHSEGDVYTHTLMVLDAAVKLLPYVKNKLGFMMSAITHDFGKAITTEIINGEIHSYNHETEGLFLVKAFMERLTNEKQLISFALNLTEHHMKPNVLALNNASIKSTNKMFDKAIEKEALICLAVADSKGKISKNGYVSHKAFFEERFNIYNEYMSRPYVMGRDLIECGIKPNEKFSEYLEFAHKLRLAGVDKEKALKQTLSFIKKR